jgi:hypothetical protein
MSADALGDVFKHSPFKGETRNVHLALGDVANDMHGNLLWMSIPFLAQKANVSERTTRRALKKLVDAGWLEPVGSEDGRKPGPGKPQRYRFLFSAQVKMAAVTAANNVGTAAISVLEPRPSSAQRTSSTNQSERNATQRSRARRSRVALEESLEVGAQAAQLARDQR